MRNASTNRAPLAGRTPAVTVRIGAILTFFITLTLSAESRRSFTVHVNDSLPVQIFGATTAYAIDPSIVETTTHGGTVTLFGRSAGKTQVVVVSLTGQTTFDVIVQSKQAVSAGPSRSTGIDGRVETRYSSAGRQVHNTIDLSRETAKARTQLHVENVRYGAELGERAQTTMPSVSYRIFTRNRELTFLDRIVDHSPLTLSSTTVRGFHYLDDRWRIHAGTTAYAAYQSFLLPADHETVVGAAYTSRLTPSTRIAPAVFIVPSEGTIASLLFDHRRSDRLTARAELGVSNGIGGAAELAFDRGRDRMRLDLRYRPRDFVTLNPGEPRGLFADGSWSKRFQGGSTIDAAVSASEFDLPGFDQRSLSASSNAHLRVNDRLAVLTGAQYGAFDTTRSFSIPLGVQLDSTRAGGSAIVRWTENSATNQGGLGFRVSGRASLGRLFATAYLDHQKQAPTLALIFREQPDLALALEELGIVATTPGDIARALRENSALIELGYIEGVTVDLAPSRTQAGFEVAWLGSGPSRPRLRGRVVLNRNESVASQTDSVIATLSASRRMTASTDVYASYTYWRTARGRDAAVVQPIVEAGVRHHFDELPALGSRGTIRGAVVLDENLDGVPEGGIADAEVELDGARATRTASDGSFSFAGVGAGTHRVVARIPHTPDAFFTTPSRLEVNPGDVVRFGVALTPARVFGRILSEEGIGLRGVTLDLMRGTSRFRTTTDSEGGFSLVAAPGEWELGINLDSLPAGYSMTASTQSVRLDRAAPLSVELSARANRSISGYAPKGIETIVVEQDGRSVPVASDGAFSIRSLPAGEITLRAGRHVARVNLSKEPVVVKDLRFETDTPSPAPAPVASRMDGDFVVQLGAYSVRNNAVEAARRAKRSGVDTALVTSANLTLVRTGPFETRDDAASVVLKLASAGIEALVMPAQ